MYKKVLCQAHPNSCGRFEIQKPKKWTNLPLQKLSVLFFGATRCFSHGIVQHHKPTNLTAIS
ncbi:hypothetical protein Lalb_Chr01g0007111 [Lupinus albus]|uniref:Uncharacterized protein n=1 Tax=Lupinus albus TaxID=3870 RepID=A0A6A4R495_LUPAL|nr:hypothetical protein Lalb_Chr01g0007111 [Lupinus albus]